MTRFIYFTDPHGRSNSPTSRKDDYPVTVINKISYLVDLANEKNAFLLCGGDWLNRPDTSDNFVGQLTGTLRKLNNLPVYTVLGNHDVYGYNPDTFDRTPLHILEKAGIIKRLSNDNAIIVGDAALTGVDACIGLDQGEDVSHYMSFKTEKTHIHIVHGFLSVKPWPHVDVTLLKDVVGTNADILLTGHEHGGFGLKKIGEKYFCNPGSLLRVSASVGDVNLNPSYLDIEINGKDMNLKIVPLPVSIAKPSEEVIDRQKLIVEKQHQERVLSFTNSLQSEDFGTSFDPYAAVRSMKNSEHLSDAVIKLMLEKMQEAEV